MSVKTFTTLTATMLLMLCGCVSFEYEGKSDAPTDAVQLFAEGAKPDRPGEVLGLATVSGNYQDVSYDRLTARLISEAESRGANAVRIVAQQVLPGDVQTNVRPKYDTAFDYDDSSRSWGQLYRDVDLRYGSVRGTPDDTASVVNYRRVIRAEFIRYTGSAAPAVAAPQKPTAAPAATAK